MSEKSPHDIITSYRKRQRYGPVIISALALLLISLGLLFLWLWLSGRSFGSLSVFIPNTPVPAMTIRPTVTLVPTRTLVPTDAASPTVKFTPTALVPFQITVQAGDTLAGYAEQFGLDPELGILLIMSYHGWEPGHFLQPGEIITIPHPDAVLFTPTPVPSNLAAGTEILYWVLPGDTIASIADEFLSTVDDIIAANDLDDPNQIEVGSWLFVPVNLVTPTVPPLVSITPQPEIVDTFTPVPTETLAP